MKKQLSAMLFLVLGIASLLFGQNASGNQKKQSEDYRFFKNEDTRLNHVNFFEIMRSKMNLSLESKMVLVNQNQSSTQQIHYKYQQYHADIPIFGAFYNLHEKNGQIHRASGNFYANIKQSAQPKLSESAATMIAQNKMKKNNSIAVKTDATLCYVDANFPKVSKSIRLAYQIDLYVEKPLDKHRYFVDASTGKIIGDYTLIQHEGVPSTAKTKYYGIQNITTDSVAPKEFILQDKTRGKGIFVKNINNAPFTSTSKNWNLDNANLDEFALDAHYCAQEYYDLMKNQFSWQSIDGKGEKAINIVVHFGWEEVNAFWDGNAAHFGDGDCDFGALTTLEVVGHELTHGLIENTSNLIYLEESGAINESLADIFGKYLEHKKDSANFSWNLGQSFILSDTVQPFRIMNDPKALEMPALYEGEFWEADNDVHTNSSIGNLWFTFIVDGKKGINENNTPYDVSAIGFDKAMKIVFETNHNYLSEQSNYNDFYEYSTAVAEDLYGTNSKEYLAVVEAWKAVGLVNNSVTGVDLSINKSYSPAICAKIGDVIPFTIMIKNQGSVDFVPDSTSKINIVLNGKTFNVKLDSFIASGETIEFTTTPFWKITNFDFLFPYIKLNIIDANATNNSATIGYNVIENNENDVELDFVYSVKETCFKDDVFSIISIRNASCEPIPVGEMFKLIAKNKTGAKIWDTIFVLKDPILPDSWFDVSVGFSSTEPTLDWSLEYSKDKNNSNNKVNNVKIYGTPTIDASYTNNFENIATVDEKMEIQGLWDNYLIDIKGNGVFACTGYLLVEEFKESCRYAPSIFSNAFAFLTASIHSCVDFSKYSNGFLEFDVMEHRNTKANELKYPYSAMLEAKWTGTESGNSIIYGNPEGVMKHYKFPLPKFFKGEVTFKMNTNVGEWEADSDRFDEDDFIILDNISFSTGSVDVKTLSELDKTTIFPNPTTGKISIQTSSEIASLELYDVNGRLVTKQNIAQKNNSELDLSLYNSGIYILKIGLADKKILTRKIVKIE